MHHGIPTLNVKAVHGLQHVYGFWWTSITIVYFNKLTCGWQNVNIVSIFCWLGKNDADNGEISSTSHNKCMWVKRWIH